MQILLKRLLVILQPIFSYRKQQNRKHFATGSSSWIYKWSCYEIHWRIIVWREVD